MVLVFELEESIASSLCDLGQVASFFRKSAK